MPPKSMLPRKPPSRPPPRPRIKLLEPLWVVLVLDVGAVVCFVGLVLMGLEYDRLPPKERPPPLALASAISIKLSETKAKTNMKNSVVDITLSTLFLLQYFLQQ
jgi:hypothetical protein